MKNNPKLIGSEIIDCIPQTGHCPNKCECCFYNNGFYRTIDQPLVPSVEEVGNRLVRVNSGHDSNIDKKLVLKTTEKYKRKFYNTSLCDFDFPAPVVYTANGREACEWFFLTRLSDKDLKKELENIMAVRVRVNTWNNYACDYCIKFFTSHSIPVLLTFMRYHQYEQVKNIEDYDFHKHILHDLYCIKEEAFNGVVERYAGNELVQVCGKVYGNSYCKNCHLCVKNYERVMNKKGE